MSCWIVLAPHSPSPPSRNVRHEKSGRAPASGLLPTPSGRMLWNACWARTLPSHHSSGELRLVATRAIASLSDQKPLASRGGAGEWGLSRSPTPRAGRCTSAIATPRRAARAQAEVVGPPGRRPRAALPQPLARDRALRAHGRRRGVGGGRAAGARDGERARPRPRDARRRRRRWAQLAPGERAEPLRPRAGAPGRGSAVVAALRSQVARRARAAGARRGGRPSCCSERPRQNSAKSFVGAWSTTASNSAAACLVARAVEQRAAEGLADGRLVRLQIAGARQRNRRRVEVAVLEKLRPALEEVVDVVGAGNSVV